MLFGGGFKHPPFCPQIGRFKIIAKVKKYSGGLQTKSFGPAFTKAGRSRTESLQVLRTESLTLRFFTL